MRFLANTLHWLSTHWVRYRRSRAEKRLADELDSERSRRQERDAEVDRLQRKVAELEGQQAIDQRLISHQSRVIAYLRNDIDAAIGRDAEAASVGRGLELEGQGEN